MDKTAIMVILDRSDSMHRVRDDVVGGFNKFVEDQKKLPGEAALTLIQFDDQYQVDYVNCPIQDVPELRFDPRGGTALLDALGRGISTLGIDLANMAEDERPGRVIVLVMTDGRENASVEYTKDRVRKMIQEQQEKYNWEFVFIGADMQSIADAHNLGIRTSAKLGITKGGMADSFDAMSRGIGSYRKGGGYKVS